MTIRLEAPGWQPMESAPRDGSSFDVLCRSKDGVEIEVENLHYGPRPLSAKDFTNLILWGKYNFLSPYLEPIGWRR